MARYHDGLFQKNYDTNAFMNNIKAIENIQAITHNMYEEEVEMSPLTMLQEQCFYCLKLQKITFLSRGLNNFYFLFY